MTKAALEISNLSIRFSDKIAVHHLDLSVPEGSFTAVVGESGSGKSLTALAIGGLTPSVAQLTSDKLFAVDTDIKNCSAQDLRGLLGDEITYIFQEPMTALNPVLRIRKQMLEQIQAHRKMSRDDAEKLCIDWLKRVQIEDAERVFMAYPHQLSGGLRQRVMIAMALMLRPKLLIADEPTTALDVTVQREILDLLRTLQKEEQTTVLFITHDLDLVQAYADHVAVMYAGEVVEAGDTKTVFAAPGHPYTQGLVLSTPRQQVKGETMRFIPGRVETRTTKSAGCAFASRCPIVQQSCRADSIPLEELGSEHHVRCIKALRSWQPELWSHNA